MKLKTQVKIRKSWFEIFYITSKTNIDAVDMKKLWIMKIEWRNFENESVVLFIRLEREPWLINGQWKTEWNLPQSRHYWECKSFSKLSMQLQKWALQRSSGTGLESVKVCKIAKRKTVTKIYICRNDLEWNEVDFKEISNKQKKNHLQEALNSICTQLL